MVYLVDDDVDDLEIIQAALMQNQYQGQVKTAGNGKLFINDLSHSSRSQRPDVIILDLNMPLKNGFQVLEEMKNHDEWRSIPVVVLTSSKNELDELRCLELGCQFYFHKPYRLEGYEPIARVVKELTTPRN